MYDIFSIPDFKFPENFLWGTSTAGHQIEGNNIYSQNWADELTRPVDDVYKPSGMACNHYNMVEEDISLMKELEAPGYRMSIEWARIEPFEGQFSQEAIDHYLSELESLKKNGFKIFLTLHHFTHPLWFEKEGGFLKPENKKFFERYLEKIVPMVAPYVDSWNVFNEINADTSYNAQMKKLAIMPYHALGYHIIKKYSDAPVSTAHAYIMFDPSRRYDKFDRAAADLLDCQCNEFFFHAIRTGEVVVPGYGSYYDKSIKDTADYWAINIYTRSMVDSRNADFKGKRYDHKHLKLLPMDFYLDEFVPEVIIHQLSRLKDKPVYITENGFSGDDDWRIVYVTLYLNALHEAIRMGVDVKGYFYWSLMDNYEWSSFVPKFGLIDVNFDTFERKFKDSAYFYRDIVRNNGLSQDILTKYINKLPIIKNKGDLK